MSTGSTTKNIEPLNRALKSLADNKYHKLIIGAALKDFKSIEEYAYLFTHAQADAIDISAFPLSLISAQRGINRAIAEDPKLEKPLIMVSVNIGADPHFRRIKVDWDACTRCELCIPSCPADAFYIATKESGSGSPGFNYEANLCYGCSNCLPYCSYDALSFENWDSSSAQTIAELIDLGANAFEIHLSADLQAFEKFYKNLPCYDSVLESFSIGSGLLNQEELHKAAHCVIKNVKAKHGEDYPLVLQIDGIPLAGARDLYSLKESGYTLESEDQKDLISIHNAALLIEDLKSKFLKNSAYIQISGGSTEKSLAKAHKLGVPINGVAIGSYARKALKGSDPIKLAKSLFAHSKEV